MVYMRVMNDSCVERMSEPTGQRSVAGQRRGVGETKKMEVRGDRSDQFEQAQ